MKNEGTSFSDIFWSEQNWGIYSVFIENCCNYTLLGPVVQPGLSRGLESKFIWPMRALQYNLTDPDWPITAQILEVVLRRHYHLWHLANVPCEHTGTLEKYATEKLIWLWTVLTVKTISSFNNSYWTVKVSESAIKWGKFLKILSKTMPSCDSYSSEYITCVFYALYSINIIACIRICKIMTSPIYWK